MANIKKTLFLWLTFMPVIYGSGVCEEKEYEVSTLANEIVSYDAEKRKAASEQFKKLPLEDREKIAFLVAKALIEKAGIGVGIKAGIYDRKIISDAVSAIASLDADAAPALFEICRGVSDDGFQCKLAAIELSNMASRLSPEMKDAIAAELYRHELYNNNPAYVKRVYCQHTGHLAAMGKQGVPYLEKLLSSKKSSYPSIMALGDMGADAGPAVPAIAFFLNDKNQNIRYETLKAIEKIKTNTQSVIPQIENLLDDKDMRVRYQAVQTLKSLGVKNIKGAESKIRTECPYLSFALEESDFYDFEFNSEKQYCYLKRNDPFSPILLYIAVIQPGLNKFLLTNTDASSEKTKADDVGSNTTWTKLGDVDYLPNEKLLILGYAGVREDIKNISLKSDIPALKCDGFPMPSEAVWQTVQKFEPGAVYDIMKAEEYCQSDYLLKNRQFVGAITGDFNGDGLADIVFQTKANNATTMWIFHGSENGHELFVRRTECCGDISLGERTDADKKDTILIDGGCESGPPPSVVEFDATKEMYIHVTENYEADGYCCKIPFQTGKGLPDCPGGTCE